MKRRFVEWLCSPLTLAILSLSDKLDATTHQLSETKQFCMALERELNDLRNSQNANKTEPAVPVRRASSWAEFRDAAQRANIPQREKR